MFRIRNVYCGSDFYPTKFITFNIVSSVAGQVYKEISLTSTISKQIRATAKENLLQLDFNIFYRYHSSLQCFGSDFIWSGSSILGWITILIKGFNSKKLKKFTAKKINVFFISKIDKGHPSYRSSLQPSKENIQHFKTWNFLHFSILWVIFALLN
jgi:hypothetical protein